MTVGKAAALTAAFLGAFALGVAVGPSMTRWTTTLDTQTTTQPTEKIAEKTEAPVAKPAPRTAPRPRPVISPSKAPESTVASKAMVPLSEPRLHDRVRPLLNRGARMEIAADGFKNAEQFAAVAHASHNTNVPFMVLKHRVVEEGRSLADAIHEANPKVDADAEAQRALRAAKSDVAAVAG